MAKKLGMKSRLIWIFSKTQTVTMLVFFTAPIISIQRSQKCLYGGSRPLALNSELMKIKKVQT